MSWEGLLQEAGPVRDREAGQQQEEAKVTRGETLKMPATFQLRRRSQGTPSFSYMVCHGDFGKKNFGEQWQQTLAGKYQGSGNCESRWLQEFDWREKETGGTWGAGKYLRIRSF